ncbi:MAG: formylmethanofuran dehydrogenase subunit E family protein [Syntrophaceae bacterium]
MNIGPYGFEEYIEKVKGFHGSVAPGLVAGGIMVDIARANLPEGELFDVLCETKQCLADAVQLLTPCTIGNGWLKIVDTSRYALIFFNKYTGEGVRVYLDAAKLSDWPALKGWFLKETPKKTQDRDQIIDEFKRAGTSLYGIEKVKVKPEYLSTSPKKSSPVGICPGCGEAYRLQHGAMCPACQGKGPY